jgi:hypothetical protein
MLVISNAELKAAPPVAEHVQCWICGETHPVESASDQNKPDSIVLSFFRCGNATYLCGVNGKEFRSN